MTVAGLPPCRGGPTGYLPGLWLRLPTTRRRRPRFPCPREAVRRPLRRPWTPARPSDGACSGPRSRWEPSRFLSRITGLLREYTHAHFLGTGLGADAFRIALQIPSVFRRLVGEGAISSAFVPVFTRHIQSGDREEIRRFAEKFFTLWTVGLLVITAAGMALAGRALLALQGVVAWKADELELTASLTRWLFPYLFLIGLSAVAGGILNSFKVFALPSATPLLFNLSFIACGACLSPLFPGDRVAYGFAVGVLLGGALQIGVLLPSLRRLGLRLRPRWPGGHSGVREVLRQLVPGTFGAGIYQINVMLSSFLALRLPGNGQVAALGYAQRLMEFVLGVFVFALATVSITTLSRQAAAGDRPGFRSTLSEVLRLTTFITVPSAVGLYLLQGPVIALVFQSGKFDAGSARLTAAAFQWYVPGIVLVGVNRVIVAAFYSLKDIWTPVRVAAINLAVNLGGSWLLMRTMGHAGIALALHPGGAGPGGLAPRDLPEAAGRPPRLAGGGPVGRPGRRGGGSPGGGLRARRAAPLLPSGGRPSPAAPGPGGGCGDRLCRRPVLPGGAARGRARGGLALPGALPAAPGKAGRALSGPGAGRPPNPQESRSHRPARAARLSRSSLRKIRLRWEATVAGRIWSRRARSLLEQRRPMRPMRPMIWRCFDVRVFREGGSRRRQYVSPSTSTSASRTGRFAGRPSATSRWRGCSRSRRRASSRRAAMSLRARIG